MSLLDCHHQQMYACAGFAGVEDFDFYQSGALLALNTFGPHLLACLALPLVCLSAWDLDAPAASGAWWGRVPIGLGTNFSSSRNKPAARRPSPPEVTVAAATPVARRSGDSSAAHDTPRQPSSQSSFRKRFLAASLAAMSCRTLTVAAATASAAIQRRHLMVWALFAPKYLFEAVTLLICDVVLVLVALAA